MSASSNALLETALRQHPALLALGRSLVGSAGEDLVQDALLAAVRHPRPVANPLAWFRRVLKNRAVSQHRSASRRRDREERNEVQDDPESPELLTQRTQILDALLEEWASLEAPYAETLRLRFEEELTAREIGERQDCPTNTASWRVREGVSRLRARLDERFGDRQHWLGALVAVPGLTSGVPKAAATTTHPMKTASILAIATISVTAAVATLAKSSMESSPASSPTRPALAAESPAGPPKGEHSSRAANPSVPGGMPTALASGPTDTRALAAEFPVSYGVMIESRGTGREDCAEEISELASLGREVYPGCAEDAGFDPQAKFSMEVEYASVDGQRTRTAKPSLSGSEGEQIVACLEDQLLSEEIDLSAFSGRLTLMFRPLGADEESPAAMAGRASALPAQVFPEFDLAWRGSPNAAATVLECVDPDCPFTRRAAASVDRLLDEHDGEVRVAQLQRPLPMHDGARKKSRALIAAAAHRQYWAAADYMHMHPGRFGNDDFRALATELDLDPDAFLRKIDSEDTAHALDQQEEACMAAGARGTPTFFVEGHRMAGAVPYEALEMLVEQQAD